MKTLVKVCKYIVFGVLGLFALMIIIGACSDDSATETTTTEPAKVEEKPEPKKEVKKEKPAPKKVEKQYNIGDTLKVGDLVFTVHGKETASNVGGQFGKNATGKYLIIETTIENKGKEAVTINSSYFKVLGKGGVEYDADGSADVYANEAGKSFFLQKINPGVSFKGKMVFDMPADAVDSEDLKLNVQTGAWGTEQGKINLK